MVTSSLDPARRLAHTSASFLEVFMHRVMSVAIVLVSLVGSAQPKELTTADLPPHLTRDLTAAQRELVVSALHRARLSCTDSAAQCLMRALSAAETAAKLVRAGKPVAEVAAAVSDSPPADTAAP